MEGAKDCRNGGIETDLWGKEREWREYQRGGRTMERKEREYANNKRKEKERRNEKKRGREEMRNVSYSILLASVSGVKCS